MSYFYFDYKGTKVILDPETIIDIRRQLEPQVKDILFLELVRTVRAVGVSPRNLVVFFKKIKEEMK